MDHDARKTILRKFHYGLFVLAARDGDQVAMMTVNFVTQAAFEPPALVVSMERESRTRAVVEATGAFALSLLAEGQRELAGQLGRHSVRSPAKQTGVEWRPGPATGAPLLAVALGWLECRVLGTLPCGDHIVYTAQVIEAGVQSEDSLLTMASTGFKHAG